MSAFVWLDTVALRSRVTRGITWLLAAVAMAASAAAFAQGGNSIDAVTVSKGTSGNTIVKFTLKSPPANPPAGFAIASPPRIALDFLDTGNSLGSNQRTVDDASLRSLNVIQAGTRTRVVFNLNKPATFQTQVEGNNVLVTLYDQSEQLDAKQQTVQRFAEARPGDVQHALRDVDFRRGRNGEGRDRRRPLRRLHRHRHPAAGPHADRRLREDVAAAQPRAPPRRAGLRHARGQRRHLQPGARTPAW